MKAKKRFPRATVVAGLSLCVACSLCSAACAALSSCAVNPETVAVWGGDVAAPEMKAVSVVSEEALLARFTSPVTVLDASVTVPSDGRQFTANWTVSDDGTEVSFAVAGTPGIGVRAFLSGSVSDGKGSTLSFSVPYTGYNARPASLEINEVRLEYSKPKVEYIEFYVRGAGNLGGVQICNPRNEKCPTYEFPAVEVVIGDYIVYHLRSMEEGLVNETGPIDVSAGTDSSPFARDFWDTQKSAPLKGDNVILVRERESGPIMDALFLSTGERTDWPSDAVTLAAGDAVAAGQWKSGVLIGDAFLCADATPTRTICRDQKSTDTDSVSDWAICAKSKHSPGKANPLR